MKNADQLFLVNHYVNFFITNKNKKLLPYIANYNTLKNLKVVDGIKIKEDFCKRIEFDLPYSKNLLELEFPSLWITKVSGHLQESLAGTFDSLLLKLPKGKKSKKTNAKHLLAINQRFIKTPRSTKVTHLSSKAIPKLLLALDNLGCVINKFDLSEVKVKINNLKFTISFNIDVSVALYLKNPKIWEGST